MKNCLVVLGMHRSGTSAFTGVLARLGVQLGDDLMAAKPDNPKGFFENTFVVDTNEQALELLGSGWDLPFALPPNWPQSLENAGLRQQISNFLCEAVQPDQLYAFKDPRLSTLLPLWQPCFAAAGVRDHYAILVRNPLEIAESLASRNGLSRNHCLALWLQYTLAAERHTRNLPRAFVDFNQLMSAPEQCVQQVFQTTGLPPADQGPDSAQQLADFVDAGMRHHDSGATQLPADCPPLIKRCYALFCQIAARGEASEEDLRMLDEFTAEFEAGQALFCTDDIATLVRERRSLPEQLGDFLNSPPWRIYRAYQAAVEVLFPEGSRLRKGLQKIKSFFF